MEKHTWAWRCGSHAQRELNPGLIFPNTNSQGGFSLLFFACLSYLLFSWQVSLYPKPMWWAHVPEGSSAQSHILCNTHWLQMNSKEFWQEKEVFCLKEEKEVVVGYFRDSWGFVGIPLQLCYQLQLGIRGYSRGILGWDGFGRKMYK